MHIKTWHSFSKSARHFKEHLRLFVVGNGANNCSSTSLRIAERIGEFSSSPSSSASSLSLNASDAETALRSDRANRARRIWRAGRTNWSEGRSGTRLRAIVRRQPWNLSDHRDIQRTPGLLWVYARDDLDRHARLQCHSQHLGDPVRNDRDLEVEPERRPWGRPLAD